VERLEKTLDAAVLPALTMQGDKGKVGAACKQAVGKAWRGGIDGSDVKALRLEHLAHCRSTRKGDLALAARAAIKQGDLDDPLRNGGGGLLELC
jgi:hypothetical protein